ncbi:uncharacterized protein L3040_002812 [Drepanopeziza brunnea f. sp. 'multigermtubi']|uniref:Zinc knuckle protein n=1 Tax=Marssonina brunnea f. sp. multigermtubi (strain MB_m1) TaxID=1072389 RepID=K1XLI4_MARBU|nr:Zinc knuckle protein [Drepanopeziza brunnea f. sp. 'multigermtubi' MB_m1]EKD13324.1 Zinc knuckle protein [Drepanopeziza brunnea f. sp. 'multigermtubi' MB_m1]KAJ5050945.1 hypothetical protein L3040_002812 [Drepanopeziza brunnea f. sp. 'multigermtubi']
MAREGGSKGRGGGGVAGAGAKTCNKCYQVGHLAANCYANGQASRNPPKQCGKCSKTGHLTAECRQGKGANTAAKHFACTVCKMNNHTTADCTRKGKAGSTTKTGPRVTRPCRWCSEMHLDRDCPVKGGNYGGSSTSHDEDVIMVDAFGPAWVDPACHHCGVQHFSNDCPSILLHPQPGQFRFPRFTAPTQPGKTVWDAAHHRDEEDDNGDAYSHFRFVNHNLNTAFYISFKMVVGNPQEEVRVDADGDVIMTSDW